MTKHAFVLAALCTSLAHGGQAHLNMIPLKGARAASVIAHEAGHVLEQRARSAEKNILDRWAEAVKADNIDVSPYGNKANPEDQAELARLYAISLAHGPESFARFRSLTPMRCAVWERMLVLTGGMEAKDAPPRPGFRF